MNFRLNKKGFTYMLIASFAIIVIIIVFLSSNAYKFQDQEALYQIRIRAMNDFVKNFNSDVHRATYISAYRTLLALEDTVTSSGVFLNDTGESFRETFFYGTINGTASPILENSSFQDYLSRVSVLADSVGIVLNVNITKIELTQPNPWSIDVHVFADINMTDKKRLASWIYTKEFVTNLPITDLRDPLYGKFTSNKAPNTIRTLNSTTLVIGTDTTNLQNLINGSYYIASSYAPNYLMRFEGNISPDPNGIESIINVRVLSDQDIPVDLNKTKIDFMYFYNMTNDSICNIQNIPINYYFIIPRNRIALYNITSLNYTNCTG